MEPCLFRHGKTLIMMIVILIILMLQWSHVFSDMVRMITEGKENTPTHALQWSHVFSDMVRAMIRLQSSLRRLLQWSHVFSDMVRGAL